MNRRGPVARPMTALGAKRKPPFRIAGFRFCPITDSHPGIGIGRRRVETGHLFSNNNQQARRPPEVKSRTPTDFSAVVLRS